MRLLFRKLLHDWQQLTGLYLLLVGLSGAVIAALAIYAMSEASDDDPRHGLLLSVGFWLGYWLVLGCAIAGIGKAKNGIKKAIERSHLRKVSGTGTDPNSAITAVVGWASLITALTAAAIIVKAAIPSRSGWAFEILVPGVAIAIAAVFLAIMWASRTAKTSQSTTFLLGWGALLTGFMAAIGFRAYTMYESPYQASPIRVARRRIVRRVIRRGSGSSVGLEFDDSLLVIAIILTVAALVLGLIWAKMARKQTGSSLEHRN